MAPGETPFTLTRGASSLANDLVIAFTPAFAIL